MFSTIKQKNVNISDKLKPFDGCNAGKSFFHIDPLGYASICKIGRHPNVDLFRFGINGLRRLETISDKLIERDGTCASCDISQTCPTCPLQVRQYRKACASEEFFCQR